jgi:hypothetical protein
MSRLDSAIRRLLAQRACLDRAIELTAGVPGPAIELGLGNGRTYDHLREKLGDREIFVFEREVMAHPDSRPDDAHLIRGDLRLTLPHARARIGRPAALVHIDIGSGDRAATAAIAAFISEALPALLAPGAIVVSDQPLALAGAAALALPDGVAGGRYFIFRLIVP